MANERSGADAHHREVHEGNRAGARLGEASGRRNAATRSGETSTGNADVRRGETTARKMDTRREEAAARNAAAARRNGMDDGLDELMRMSHDQEWLGRRPVAAPQSSRRGNPIVIAIVCAIIAIALIIAVATFLLN